MVIRLFEYGFKKAKETAEIVAREAKELYDSKEINADDLHRILLAINNIFEYLNSRYGEDEKLEEEVKKMTKTLFDPVVEARGIGKTKIEVAQKLILMGIELEKIAEATGLSKDELRKLVH